MNTIVTTAYLAAPYQARELIKTYRDELFKPAGIAVTSRWLHQQHAVTTQPQELLAGEAAREARNDLSDVYRARHFVSFSTIGNPGIEENGRGGRHVELGYALAKQKPCWQVGQPQNLFDYLIEPGHRADTPEQVIDLILLWIPEWERRMKEMKENLA